MHVPSELDPCVQLPEDFYCDEDDGSMLEPDQVAKGIQREMSSMGDLKVGVAVERPYAKKVWGGRWCFRQKGDTVRFGYAVRQFKDAMFGDVFTATPRNEAIRLLIAAGLKFDHVLPTGDFSVAFMHTPLKEEDEIYVEILAEYVYGNCYVRRPQQALHGVREAAARFKLFLERILLGTGFPGARWSLGCTTTLRRTSGCSRTLTTPSSLRRPASWLMKPSSTSRSR